METAPCTVGALLLAAGKGTRMRSSLPKCVVPVRGRPLLTWLVDALREAGVSEVGLIVGHGADTARSTLGEGFLYVTQAEQRGTAHAVQVARSAVTALRPPWDHVIVFVGDSPLLHPTTIRRLLDRHLSTGAACTFLTAVYPEIPPYARVLRDPSGRVVACIEERSCTEAQKQVRELFTSHYVFRAADLWSFLDGVKPHPGTGEQYLTDIVNLLLDAGRPVEAEQVDHWEETVGLNTPEEVAWAEAWMERRAGATHA